MVVHNLNSSQEIMVELRGGRTVVLGIYEKWSTLDESGPTMGPLMETLSEKYTNAHFVRAHLDAASEFCQDFHIPTTSRYIICRDGKIREDIPSKNSIWLENIIKMTLEPETTGAGKPNKEEQS
ncbi:hypothetical protein HI914_00069 [Erysiphe necator]|nr:hypothetical protein HI914_00069 [Erysiphe necator]